MQEELERKSISVTVQAAKLTGRVMRAAVAAALRKIEKAVSYTHLDVYKRQGTDHPGKGDGSVRLSAFLRKRRAETGRRQLPSQGA